MTDTCLLYTSLINGDYKEMCEDDFRGILTLGGTILGTKRTPFKMMRVVEDDNIDKVCLLYTSRMGRSTTRLVRMARSPGRPSRRIKLQGMRPAA